MMLLALLTATAYRSGTASNQPTRDAVAELVVELGRERPGADAGRVGLHDAHDLVDLARADAAAGAGAAGDRARARDERVAAVIEVEERALGTLQ
jgi:hypothetical protein